MFGADGPISDPQGRSFTMPFILVPKSGMGLRRWRRYMFCPSGDKFCAQPLSPPSGRAVQLRVCSTGHLQEGMSGDVQAWWWAFVYCSVEPLAIKCNHARTLMKHRRVKQMGCERRMVLSDLSAPKLSTSPFPTTASAASQRTGTKGSIVENPNFGASI